MSDFMTKEDVEAILDKGIAKMADAVKAANPVDESQRPGASSQAVKTDAPNVNLRRRVRPSLARAIKAIRDGSWTGAELERDLSQATKELYGEGFGVKSIAMPTTVNAFAAVLDAIDAETDGSVAVKSYAGDAIKAMNESIGGPNSVSYGNTAGAALVPPQFLQSEFLLALTSAVVLRAMPETQTIPVVSNVIELPRETVVATTTSAAENASLTSADPTFAVQAFTIQKQYGYRTFSNELLHDANPAIDAYVTKTLARDIALFQDLQYLEGSGAGTNLKGIRNYSGLTTSSWVAATNGSTPAASDLVKMVFDIRKANTEPTAWVMHPRTLQNIVTLVDASGRFIFSDVSVWGGPVLNPQAGTTFTYPSKAVGRLLGLPVYLSTQILTNETQGSSSAASHIIIGNFNYAAILERQAAEIAMSEHVAFATDQTAVRAIARSALALTQPLAFAVSTGII